MTKSKERLYAEHCQDQNLERFADHLRELLATNPQFYRLLNRLIHMDNVAALREIGQMSPILRRDLLEHLIPAARIGLALATFKMEDKYSEADP